MKAALKTRLERLEQTAPPTSDNIKWSKADQVRMDQFAARAHQQMRLAARASDPEPVIVNDFRKWFRAEFPPFVETERFVSNSLYTMKLKDRCQLTSVARKEFDDWWDKAHPEMPRLPAHYVTYSPEIHDLERRIHAETCRDVVPEKERHFRRVRNGYTFRWRIELDPARKLHRSSDFRRIKPLKLHKKPASRT